MVHASRVIIVSEIATYSIELVLIKLAYETNQRFDQNTLAFIRVIQKLHTEMSSYAHYLDNTHANAYGYYVIACQYLKS